MLNACWNLIGWYWFTSAIPNFSFYLHPILYVLTHSIFHVVFLGAMQIHATNQELKPDKNWSESIQPYYYICFRFEVSTLIKGLPLHLVLSVLGPLIRMSILIKKQNWITVSTDIRAAAIRNNYILIYYII